MSLKFQSGGRKNFSFEFAVLLHLLFIIQQNVTNILFFWKLLIIHGVTVVISETM